MNGLARPAAIAALVSAGAAATVGDFDRPVQLAHSAPIDVYDVATMLRDRVPFTLLDARPAGARARFALPGAIGLDEWDRADDQPVVVYGFEGDNSWLESIADHPDVRFLAHGTRRWMEAILSPTIDPSATEKELARFRDRSALSRYFGGVPRFTAETVVWTSEDDTLAELQQRGCGF